jgi:hypothetical protein
MKKKSQFLGSYGQEEDSEEYEKFEMSDDEQSKTKV